MTFEHKTVSKLSTRFAPNGLFILATHNGSIRIVGQDTNQCEVAATIRAKAPTEAEAQRLAAQVSVKLELDGTRLTAKIEEPELSNGRSIGIDFDVTIPMQTILELACHNGTIHVSNITDDIEGSAHNGSIYVKRVSGRRLKLRTHNGAIGIDYAQSREGTPNLYAHTHNGNVDLTIPSDLSTRIAISTHNGSVSSRIPMTITRYTRSVFQGVVGKGDGEISLGTHNGSIRIVAVPHDW